MWQPKSKPVIGAMLGMVLLTANSSAARATTPVLATAPVSNPPIARSNTVGSQTVGSGMAAQRAGVVAALVGTVNAGFVSRTPVPLANAGVYAYRVTDLTLHKAQTDPRGGFSFAALPAGVYKVIAHKTGFLPAIVLVTRTAASAFQELQFELFPDESSNTIGAAETGATDFWKIRQRIPSDVLREIQIAVAQSDEPDLSQEYSPSLNAAFTAKMHALSGSGTFANGTDANLVGGNIDIAGRLGGLDLDLIGNFRALRTANAATAGKAQSVALNLRSNSGDFNVTSQTGSVATEANPIDLERYGVDWSGKVGAGQTELSANYTAETNYYRDPRIDFFEVPASSRTFDISGSYAQSFGPGAGVETGIRYRERAPYGPTASRATNANATERMEWFGLGRLNLRSAVSLQYGLFTTLWDGSLAFAPQGGVVLELPHKWTAETSIRQRLNQTADERVGDFQPAQYGKRFECTSAEKGCYRVRLSKSLGESGGLEFGALYRNIGETLRVYFANDVFGDLDSLFFVDGDRLPEVHFGFSRRLSPSVMAKFESNLARGGGGITTAGLENDVRYLVTSLNTQFEGSETGVVLSFHSLEQRLLDQAGGDAFDPVAQDRLQLLITQGLSRLIGIAHDLDLVLDMQVSRSPEQRVAEADTEFSHRILAHRILGGVALRF